MFFEIWKNTKYVNLFSNTAQDVRAGVLSRDKYTQLHNMITAYSASLEIKGSV